MPNVTKDELCRVDNMKRNILHYAVSFGDKELVDIVLSALQEKALVEEITWEEDANSVSAILLAVDSPVIFSLIYTAIGYDSPPMSLGSWQKSLKLRNHSQLLVAALSSQNFIVARQILDNSFGNPANLCTTFNEYIDIEIPPTDLKTTVPLVVVGDTQAGKSSLIRSLKIEGTLPFLRHCLFNVSGADTHTAGIIPTHFESIWFGKVVFFDLSSHREFVHEAILNCGSLVDAVFLVVINLSDSIEKIAQQIVYWLSFIRYHHSKVATFGNDQHLLPNVIIIGSHLHDIKVGRIGNRERFRDRAYPTAMSRINRRDFNIAATAVLDCRKTSPENAILRYNLSNVLDRVRLARQELPTKSYIIYAIIKSLTNNERQPGSVRVGQIIEELTQEQHSHCKLFHGTTEEILELCKPLVQLNLLLKLNDTDSSDENQSWLVPDSHPLLTAVEEAIFHYEDGNDIQNGHPNHFPFNSGGILSQSQVIGLFERPNNPYNPNLLIMLMIHYKYCEEVTTKDNETAYFFPHLLKPILDIPRWEKEEGRFMFAWTLAPESQYHYFMPHLVHHFLLQLSQAEELGITNLERATRTLVWGDPSGVEVVVHIHSSQRLIVSMRSTPHHQLQCLMLRKRVVKKIVEILLSLENTSNEDKTKVVISIIPGSTLRSINFPFVSNDSLRRGIRYYKVEHIKKVVIEKQDQVLPCHHATPLVSIEDLLFFEPYYYMEHSMRQRLYQSPDECVTESDYYDICTCLGSVRLRLLDELLDNVEQPTIIENTLQNQIQQSYLRLMARHGVMTCGQLRELLDSISFFELKEIISSNVEDESQ